MQTTSAYHTISRQKIAGRNIVNSIQADESNAQSNGQSNANNAARIRQAVQTVARPRSEEQAIDSDEEKNDISDEPAKQINTLVNKLHSKEVQLNWMLEAVR